jgi:ABC-2 type transport system ATP-binding protein
MRWMRGLLRDFADRGGTVLLSSHLLHEIEALADRVVVIGNGRILTQGSLDELLAGSGTLVRATDEHALRRALRDAHVDTRKADDGGFVVDSEPDVVGQAALHGGVVLTELRPADRGGLEELFFALTSNDGPPTDTNTEEDAR